MPKAEVATPKTPYRPWLRGLNPDGTISEGLWRRAERDMMHRERVRLIRRRIIRPLCDMQPQMMVKNAEGQWIPEIKVYS